MNGGIEWNLGNGLENVCSSALRKLEYAGWQLESQSRTIINVDSYEVTAMIWAMKGYMRNSRFAKRKQEDQLNLRPTAAVTTTKGEEK